MKTTFLYISIVFNIILIIIIFFKSALNDILKEWWINKQKEKKETIQHVAQLKTNLTKLSSLIPLIFIETAQLTSGQISDPNVKDYLQNQLKEHNLNLGKINEDILANEIYYPIDIKNFLQEFSKKLAGFIQEIMTSQIHKERMLEITTEISKSISSITEKLDTHLHTK